MFNTSKIKKVNGLKIYCLSGIAKKTNRNVFPILQQIGAVTLYVRDYREAIRFYTESIGFILRSDIPLGHGEKWVTVAPHSDAQTSIVFVKATTPEQRILVGKQASDKVAMTLVSDDIHRDYGRMRAKGVHFLGEPEDQPFGFAVVFEDLYGNRLELVQLKQLPEIHTERTPGISLSNKGFDVMTKQF